MSATCSPPCFPSLRTDLGRTNAAYRLLVTGVVPIGALLGGWLGSTAGLRTTLAIGTTGLLSTALCLIFSPVRRVRKLSDLASIGAPSTSVSLAE